jgi:hypothetical protein
MVALRRCPRCPCRVNPAAHTEELTYGGSRRIAWEAACCQHSRDLLSDCRAPGDGDERMTRPRVAAAWCAIALLPLTGCGDVAIPGAGGQDPVDAETLPDAQGDAPAIDPCLVSDEEMAGILSEQLPNDEGAVTVTTETFSGVGDPVCTYMWTRSTWGEGAGKEFTLTVFPASELDLAAGTGERTPIDGAGDEAFETFDNYYARVGDTVVHLVNLQETPEASVAVLTAAAGKL